MSETPMDKAQAGRLMKWATYASVSVASVLIVTKFAAWLVTDSIALLSSLMDSLLDMAASLVNLYAVRHALQPADAEHRFGHGKAESLAGLAQAAFISGSAVFLMIEAFDRILHPTTVQQTPVGIAVMVLSIIATMFLVAFQRYVVKKTGSLAIAADSAHYQMDVLVNGSVIVSLLLVSQLDWGLADPLFAMGISLYILYGAWEIGYDSLHVLMDRELPDEDREKISQIALSHDGVLGLHDLRTRRSGTDVFIQMHLELPGDLLLLDAHNIAEDVMYAIEEAYPHAEVLIHEDPQGIEEYRADLEIEQT